jgi:hypothetical protein
MRTLSRLHLAPATPPPRDVWAVRTVEHRDALRAVDDALTVVVDALAALRPDAVPTEVLRSLGALVDEANAQGQRGGGTPLAPDPAEARRLHERADLANRLLGQIRGYAFCPRAERAVWVDRIGATVGEAMGPTPRRTQAG